MPKFKIPVLFTVEAPTEALAEKLVQDIVQSAEEMLKNHEPDKYDRWKEWGFADIRIRKHQ